MKTIKELIEDNRQALELYTALKIARERLLDYMVEYGAHTRDYYEQVPIIKRIDTALKNADEHLTI